MMLKCSPVVVFAYNRPKHLGATLRALSKNILAPHVEVFIFVDGPKTDDDVKRIDEIKKQIANCSGFKSLTAIYRLNNLGLSSSVIKGVSETLENWESVIVLEDDMITSPYFLEYMNQGLIKYKNNPLVSCIHGYVYPGLKDGSETFFLRGADCWGWGTWRESWKLFNSNGEFLLNELRNKNLIKEFDFNGSYPFSSMLENQVLGKNDSWAVRWYASIFLAGKLTLYPTKSLVQNIGMDSSGQNCINSSNYDVELPAHPVLVKDIEVRHSISRYREFESFFRRQHVNLFQRIVNRVRGWA